MAIRSEPQNEIEESLLNLSLIVGNAIIKEYPEPKIKEIGGTALPKKITIQFEDHKRKLSRAYPMWRRIIYTTRNISEIKTTGDAINLIVHECSHLAYPRHSKEFWQLFYKWKNTLEDITV